MRVRVPTCTSRDYFKVELNSVFFRVKLKKKAKRMDKESWGGSVQQDKHMEYGI